MVKLIQVYHTETFFLKIFLKLHISNILFLFQKNTNQVALARLEGKSCLVIGKGKSGKHCPRQGIGYFTILKY